MMHRLCDYAGRFLEYGTSSGLLDTRSTLKKKLKKEQLRLHVPETEKNKILKIRSTIFFKSLGIIQLKKYMASTEGYKIVK